MPRSFAHAAAVIGVACVGFVAWPAAQQKPLFKSASDLVEVDAVVTDKSGDVVRGLTRDDFEIKEDGKPQTLVQFAFVDIPMPPSEAPTTSGAVTPRTSDVSSNTHPLDSRMYVIVLDGFHVDSSRTTAARKQARQFIQDDVGPNDLTAVVLIGHGGANQSFTSNKTLLLAAVDQFIGQKSQSTTMNITNDALLRPQRDIPEDIETDAKINEARVAMASIQQVCESLGTSQGHRRSVILFSEGLEIDTTNLIGQRPGSGAMHDPAKNASEVLEAQRAMLEAARRANVALYTVDPRGQTTGEDSLIQSPVGPAGGALSMIKETQRSQGTLRTFAEETGGIAVVNSDNLATLFGHIRQANSSYYALAYSSANTIHDGAYRKISIALKPPHLDVVARKGYFAPNDAKPAPPPPVPAKTSDANAPSVAMRTLLASQLPVSGLGLRVTGGPLRAQGDKTLVALIVEIDTKTLPFGDENGLLSNDIEMAFQALDAGGKTLAANRQLGKLRLPPADRGQVTQGLRYVVEFLLPPGRAQVRVAAHESAGDGGGSAMLDMDVPNFAKTALSVSTVVLTHAAAQSMPTTGSFPLLKEALPGPPTTQREFTSSDTLTAFASVTDPDSKADTVDITTTVQAADGREVFRKSVTRPGGDLTPSSTHAGYVSEIPLRSMMPGNYVLTIAATAKTGKTASKSVAFVVR